MVSPALAALTAAEIVLYFPSPPTVSSVALTRLTVVSTHVARMTTAIIKGTVCLASMALKSHIANSEPSRAGLAL